MSTYYVLGSDLHALCALIHLVLTETLQGRCLYGAHLADEEDTCRYPAEHAQPMFSPNSLYPVSQDTNGHCIFLLEIANNVFQRRTIIKFSTVSILY